MRRSGPKTPKAPETGDEMAREAPREAVFEEEEPFARGGRRSVPRPEELALGVADEALLVARDGGLDRPRKGLTREQQATVTQAMDVLTEKTGEMKTAGRAIGTWFFKTFFDSEWERVLVRRRKSAPALDDVVDRLERGTFGLKATGLGNLIRIAAWTKRVKSRYWGLIDDSLKIVLMRLKKPDLVEKGAQHAFDMHVTYDNLQLWVDNQLPKTKKRARQFSSLQKGLGTFAEWNDDERSIERAAAAYDALPARERAKVLKNLEKTIAAAKKLQSRFKKE